MSSVQSLPVMNSQSWSSMERVNQIGHTSHREADVGTYCNVLLCSMKMACGVLERGSETSYQQCFLLRSQEITRSLRKPFKHEKLKYQHSCCNKLQCLVQGGKIIGSSETLYNFNMSRCYLCSAKDNVSLRMCEYFTCKNVQGFRLY